MRTRNASPRAVMSTALVACATTVVGALSGLAAPARGDDCPNAAIRAEQRATHLLECRAYERVSVADKNQQPVIGYTAYTLDGAKVIYQLLGGSRLNDGGVAQPLLATRGASGWDTRQVLPPLSQRLGTFNLVQEFTPDMTRMLGVAYESGGGGRFPAGLVRLDGDGGQSLLMRPDEYIDNVIATSDLQHLYVQVGTAYDPTHVPDTQNVYDVGTGTPELVSVMPGTERAPACGVPNQSLNGGFSNYSLGSRATQHWTSTDGMVVFFGSQGDDCDPFAPMRLYRVDRRTGESTFVSQPAPGGQESTGFERFLQAAPDGSWVIYRTWAQLDPRDQDETLDVYRSESGGSTVCLTCGAVPAQVVEGREGGAASEDGKRVYFVSEAELAPGATAGSRNLYRVKDGELDFVAPVAGGFNDEIDGNFGEMTADGAVVVFLSNDASLNDVTGVDNNGTVQWYRYDDRTRAIACVSCGDGGATLTQDASNALIAGKTAPDATPRRLTADGDTYVFTTPNRLVAEDVNGASDVYEWHDGRIGLVTTGRQPRRSSRYGQPIVVGVTPDGSSIYVQEFGDVGVEGGDGGNNLYVARVGGGFPRSAAPPEECHGDQCQGQPPAGPAAPETASAALDGLGNVAPAKPRPVVKLGVSVPKATRTTVATLRVTTSAAGVVTASGPSLRRTRRTLARAGTVAVRVTLTPAAKRRLARSGRLRAGVKVTLAPKAGRAVTRTTAIVFTVARKGSR